MRITSRLLKSVGTGALGLLLWASLPVYLWFNRTNAEAWSDTDTAKWLVVIFVSTIALAFIVVSLVVRSWLLIFKFAKQLARVLFIGIPLLVFLLWGSLWAAWVVMKPISVFGWAVDFGLIFLGFIIACIGFMCVLAARFVKKYQQEGTPNPNPSVVLDIDGLPTPNLDTRMHRDGSKP